MQSQVATKLRMLAETGSLPTSACGSSFLADLRPLLESGVVARERSGGGWRVVVRDATALAAVIARRFPSDSGPAVGRLAGVARYRDSKAVANDTPPVVLARALRNVLVDGDGTVCNAVEATSRHGIFAFVLGPECTSRVMGPIALVENPAVFLRFEQLDLGVEMAIGVNGRAHGRLVEWLSRQDSPGFQVLHLPDYDPTGLAEYQRLREVLGTRVRLHLPEDLATRFERHSSPRLLEGIRSRAMLAKLRASGVEEIRRVVALIDRHNAGLEQESLLVDAP